MIADIPAEYKAEAYKLDATGLVELFQMTLLNGNSLYFTGYKSLNWQGKTWTSFPCSISDVGVQTSGENNRPKLTVANPDGIFSTYVVSDLLNNATVVRFRVSPSDIDGNVNRFLKNTWRISKVMSLNKNMVIFELRSSLDGQNFKMPGNCFFPPEYPHVTLG